MTKFRGALIGLAVVAFAIGCAEPPQVEIDAAKAALEAARAEASEYAPEALSAAEDAASQLDAELKVQEEKFALMRRYETAKQLAASATEAANSAAQQAAAEKQRLQTQANDLIASAHTLITETQALLEQAPKGKGTQADIAALTADLAAAGTALADAESSVAGGRYKDAVAKAESVQQSERGSGTSRLNALGRIAYLLSIELPRLHLDARWKRFESELLACIRAELFEPAVHSHQGDADGKHGNEHPQQQPHLLFPRCCAHDEAGLQIL